MKKATGRKGFSLIELMIVIAIVAILVALALPNYTGYVRKAKRGEAEQLLMNWANLQEIWRANNPTYADADDMAVPTHDNYTFTVTGTSASAFFLFLSGTAISTHSRMAIGDASPLLQPSFVMRV